MQYAQEIKFVILLSLLSFLPMSFPTPTLASNDSYAKTFIDRQASGEQLVRAFFDLLSKTGSPAGTIGTTPEQDKASKALVKPYLDPAFLLQRASGERYNADTYLPADVDAFHIGDVRVTNPASDVVVVRYTVAATETLPDSALVMSANKAPRLTVFHWSAADARWKILTHANFNTPVAAICNKEPINDNGLKSQAASDDQVLGEKLMTRFYDLLTAGDATPILAPLIQYQNATGAGYTGLAERKATTKFPEVVFSDAVVNRNGKLLAVSVYHTGKERLLMGQYLLRGGKSANLATFMMNDDGSWQMIALASIAPSSALPDGVACVPSGKLQKIP